MVSNYRAWRWRQRSGCAALITLSLLYGCGGPVEEEIAADPAALTGSFPVGAPLRTTASVNLRSRPSLSGAVLTIIPAGTQVLSASANPQAGWYGVTWSGKTGWVSGRYLSSAPAQPVSFSRTEVRRLVSGHMRAGAEAAADDFLDGGLTTQALVNAVGWIATHNPPAWEISAVNSNHHFDPAAHSGGLAIDLYNIDPGRDLEFVQLINRNPFVVEVGFSGDYIRLRGEISGKYYFSENAPTHIHLAVRQAFGTRQ